MSAENASLFIERRKKMLKGLKEGVAVWLAPAPSDHGVYRTSGDLWYLTGINEPKVALVAVAGKSPRLHLFLRKRDPHDEVWNGPSARWEDGAKRFGVDEVHPFQELEEKLSGWLGGRTVFWASLGETEELDRLIQRVMGRLRKSRRGSAALLPMVREPGAVVHALRLIKDQEEQTLMRQAAVITTEAYRQAYGAIRPGVVEGEIAGLLEFGFRQQGGGGPSYGTIVGSGQNACYLHYVKNTKPMKSGELVVIDAGAQFQGYACDVTRTFPVNGRFTPMQGQVYDIVLEAQLAAIRRCRPGATNMQVHQAAVEVLVKGLMKLGVVKERSVSLALKKKTFAPYYPHGTGHWLGLDVHDVGSYQTADGTSATLRPGMVLTVEPGLYFSEADHRVPKALRGIGVRIEDDILITAKGHEVLTRDIPKTRVDVESVMRGGSSFYSAV